MNLADPELELIDPTPNVHIMFLHFDKTFFWAKLSSRCVVRWSKRMYSCAGICSYEGRGGLCDIALSEPLLKLRSRKDMVETLLHEMIHAFLFITRQDQNRDGHGPNFQAHMHRINRAAGLNISIYHDFHDEVKLYQTHWWRCNGPCQSWRPHFGIVRRTANRAPGKSDFWWDDHNRKCGGTFIKIKEPDKKSKYTKVAKPSADITKYIHNKNKEVNNKNIVNIQNNKKTPILKDTSNLLSKTNGNTKSAILVNKKNVIFNPQTPKPVPFSGTGQTLNDKHQNISSVSVLETVREVWANKQLETKNNRGISKNINRKSLLTPNKHKADTHTESPPPKIKKIDDYFKTRATSMLKDLYGQDFNVTLSNDNQKLIVTRKKIDLVDCPVCNNKVNSSEMNKHLDECLNKSTIDEMFKEKDVAANNKEFDRNESKKNKSRETIADVTSIVKKETVVKNVKGNVVSGSTIKKETIDDRTPSNAGFTNNVHRKTISFDDSDLKSIFQIDNTKGAPIKTEPSCSKTDFASEKECPCCGVKLNKSVEEHLEECLSFFDNNTTIPEEGASNSLTDTVVINDDKDEFDETLTMNATGTKLPCPCCMDMVEEINMNNHLDVCLT